MINIVTASLFKLMSPPNVKQVTMSLWLTSSVESGSVVKQTYCDFPQAHVFTMNSNVVKITNVTASCYSTSSTASCYIRTPANGTYVYKFNAP
jgi:hypothetical protein